MTEVNVVSEAFCVTHGRKGDMLEEGHHTTMIVDQHPLSHFGISLPIWASLSPR